MTIAMRTVTSSNIAQVGHSEETSTLRVAFNNGGIYEYAGVPRSIYTALIEAESVGKAFNELVKRAHYPFTKIQ